MDNVEISNIMEQKVAELLELLDVSAAIQVDILESDGKQYIDIKLDSEEFGAELIGHRGNRLKSLSAVLNMMLPRTEERYSILLDINGYKDQRTQHIIDKTHQAAERAIESFEPVRLEPMSPWERRVVHMAIAERTDIVTESDGEGDDRHVVIKPVSVV